MAQTVKKLSTMQETWVRSLGQEIPWRKEWIPIPVSLLGEFNPFTFKVIIDKYDPVAIYFIVLGSSYTPFLCLLPREYPLAFVGELVWWC